MTARERMYDNIRNKFKYEKSMVKYWLTYSIWSLLSFYWMQQGNSKVNLNKYNYTHLHIIRSSGYVIHRLNRSSLKCSKNLQSIDKHRSTNHFLFFTRFRNNFKTEIILAHTVQAERFVRFLPIAWLALFVSSDRWCCISWHYTCDLTRTV